MILIVVLVAAALLSVPEGLALSKGQVANIRASVIALSAMIEASPNDAELYFERALLQKKLGNYKSAAQDLKIVELLKYPHFRFELYTLKGLCDFLSGEYYKAVEDYNFALQVNPRADYCYANRACAFLKIHRYKLAINDCHQAIKLNSLAGAPFSTAAECYYRSGQYKYAIDYSSKAIQRDPDDAKAYYFRGAAYRKIGQKLAGDLDIAKAAKLGLKVKEL